MEANEPLAAAIADWQRKYRISDADPMIAALELVRIYLQSARNADDAPDSQIPSFEDFRSTIELLDRRSKSFVSQASDLIGELRRFGQKVERLNRARFATVFVLGAMAGGVVARCL